MSCPGSESIGIGTHTGGKFGNCIGYSRVRRPVSVCLFAIAMQISDNDRKATTQPVL
jgi:hypothetical protein